MGPLASLCTTGSGCFGSVNTCFLSPLSVFESLLIALLLFIVGVCFGVSLQSLPLSSLHRCRCFLFFKCFDFRRFFFSTCEEDNEEVDEDDDECDRLFDFERFFLLLDSLRLCFFLVGLRLLLRLCRLSSLLLPSSLLLLLEDLLSSPGDIVSSSSSISLNNNLSRRL